jgi:repressor of nif and glnA expression
MGVALQPRTVRFYLLQLDEEGLTELISRRKGRTITNLGREELSHANVMEKVGFVAMKVANLSYRMSFNVTDGTGTIITNTAVVRYRDLSRALGEMKHVFDKRLSMGTKLRIAQGGEEIGTFKVPAGNVGIATICSLTVNGILLAERIPVTPRFGGLLEMRDGKPARFVELMEYTGTTVDPLETFAMADMTRVRECAQTGTGIIGASFREIPSLAADDMRRLQHKMDALGLSGVLAIGRPGQPLFDIPVAEGRTGIVVIGGLNPMAAVHEAGIAISLESLSGLEDFSKFSTFKDVYRQYMDYLRRD